MGSPRLCGVCASMSAIPGADLGANTVQTEEFIQVLHTGHGHWVTMSTVGCKDREINIYDSLPPAPTSHLMNQIAALLATPKPAIAVKYMDTQMQCGSTDCGIFAIAFAAAPC